MFWEPNLKNREKGEAIRYPLSFQSFADRSDDRMTGRLEWNGPLKPSIRETPKFCAEFPWDFSGEHLELTVLRR